MKILSVGNFLNGWDGSICDEEHIATALEKMGHTVTRWQRGEIGTFDRNGKYDFALIAQWDGYGEKLFEMLREISKVTVYWAFDYQAAGQPWHEWLVANSDLYLSKRIADSRYRNWQWLSQDFAPDFLDKWDAKLDSRNYELDGRKKTIFKDIDVLFTGSYLPWAIERIETLKAIDKKFNLVIHTVNPEGWNNEGFKDVRAPIMDEGLPELYARAKVVISIDHTIEAGYWSDRAAQAMCCGAFVLHRYQPLSTAVFRSYIGYFYDIDTCLLSLEHWIEADEDRENLAAWGYEYAQAELKVGNRVADLLCIVQEKIQTL
jgi:hypothetical protein